MEVILPPIRILNPPLFVPCSHYKKRYMQPVYKESGYFSCNCLDPALENYIYRFHDNECCFQKSEQLGHDQYQTDGFYKTERPVWKSECYCDFDQITKDKIESVCNLLNLKCICTCDFTCKLCNYILCNKDKKKAKLYVNRDLLLDLESLLHIQPFVKF